ncbi:MAG: hypothetical protein WDZ59_05725 [Pirellulales bacterium]
MTEEEAAKTALRILHDSDTKFGRMMLRKRWSLALDRHVFEMLVSGKLMMSSAVTTSEEALAQMALALLPERRLAVLVGGLGFGFTTMATLADRRVSEVTVVEKLEDVVGWHYEGILPWSDEFVRDPRLQIIRGDFFERIARNEIGLFDAILIDIDDSPSLLWHHQHAAAYRNAGLSALEAHVRPSGVVAFWFAEHPSECFINSMRAVFADAVIMDIPFEDPCHRRAEVNYIVLARRADDGAPR